MKIAILGSTGSIGTSTLEIINKYPERYEAVALAAGNNVDLLAGQMQKFKPALVCLADEEAAMRLRSQSAKPATAEIVSGQEGLIRVATLSEADIVVVAISGSAGLIPTISAVRAGKNIALANKESLVMAGRLLIDEAERNNCRIIPVDSEHSAIFQLLDGHNRNEVRNIILTASGGPFLDYTKEELEKVTPADALKHPRWKMGNKVTTDSASLMNKALEIIEARWLFGLPHEKIKVVIHPQSIIHSMVEFIDGSVFAHLSQPDMKGPIAYALSCPQRLHNAVAPLDLTATGMLTFSAPDVERFPAIGLAYRALKAGGLMATVMNAANEVAVSKFHEGLIKFLAIPRLTQKVMDRFKSERDINLENILWADEWARQESKNVLAEINKG